MMTIETKETNEIRKGDIIKIYKANQCCSADEAYLSKFQEKYGNFHQHILVADETAIGFCKKQGFVIAAETIHVDL